MHTARDDRAFLYANTCFEEARECYPEDSTDMEVQMGIADVWDRLGDLNRNYGFWLLENDRRDDAKQHIEKAKSWYESLKRFAVGHQWSEKVATALGDVGRMLLVLASEYAIGESRHDQFARAEEELKAGLKLAKEIQRLHTIAFCQMGLGELYATWQEGKRDRALRRFRWAKKLYDESLRAPDVVAQIEKWIESLQNNADTGPPREQWPAWVLY